jgi:hypothetical protein
MKEALSSSETTVLQEPQGVTSQKTPFFIVTVVKTSDLRYGEGSWSCQYWNPDQSVGTFVASRHTDFTTDRGTVHGHYPTPTVMGMPSGTVASCLGSRPVARESGIWVLAGTVWASDTAGHFVVGERTCTSPAPYAPTGSAGRRNARLLISVYLETETEEERRRNKRKRCKM